MSVGTSAMNNQYTLAVFASDKGPGDAERSSIMSQVGTFLAGQGVRIVCPVHAEGLCVPLINSAKSAGGDVLVIAGEKFTMPSALSDITVETFVSKGEKQQRIGALCDAFIGLPGSLGSVISLYETWVGTGGVKPVSLLNRNRAYEVLRGFAVDIISNSMSDWERHLQFSETIEDMWSRLNRTLNAS